jgi:hypothetical protein
MRGNYTDFISAYCDTWCERCAFTDRCSHFAVRIAAGMCDGDVMAGLELAAGEPPPMDEAERKQRQSRLDVFANCVPTHAEVVQCERERQEREERLDQSPITTLGKKVSLLAGSWLDSHRGIVAETPGLTLVQAIEVATWDSYFIHVKLHRALGGRDEAAHGDTGVEDPIQNDWNGSAKIALISIERSIVAWQVIASATGDPDAAQIAGELQVLQCEVHTVFPDARKFRRPGFDDAVDE